MSHDTERHPERDTPAPHSDAHSVDPQWLSDLIGRIYDCAVDPTGWEAVLADVQRQVHCANAILAVQSLPAGSVLLAATNDIPPAELVRLSDYGPDVIDQWGGIEAIAQHSLDEPAVLSWERPREPYADNRYYVEWAIPQGIVDVIGIIVARDAHAYGTIGFGRHASAGPVTPGEIDLLRLIVPHFQRAVSISRLLDIKAIVARNLEAALDAVAAGIVLVDADLRIVHANRAAEIMLADGGPISAGQGRLALRSQPARQALQDAVTQASVEEAQIGRRGFGIPARWANGDPAALYVLPLRRGNLRPGLSPAAAAAVFVAPAAAPFPAPEQTLAALFDLTSSEAKVFSLVGAGRSIAETAEDLGIVQSTARTHLARVFAKTGCKRQAELVALADRLSLPL